MEELLVDTPTDAKDLVKSLLVMDPKKRLTAKEALCHKYVEKYEYKIYSSYKMTKFVVSISLDFAILRPNWS